MTIQIGGISLPNFVLRGGFWCPFGAYIAKSSTGATILGNVWYNTSYSVLAPTRNVLAASSEPESERDMTRDSAPMSICDSFLRGGFNARFPHDNPKLEVEFT